MQIPAKDVRGEGTGGKETLTREEVTKVSPAPNNADLKHTEVKIFQRTDRFIFSRSGEHCEFRLAWVRQAATIHFFKDG